MRLIWSALWEAFPREIHLISEFLIPSLLAQAWLPSLLPRRWKGEVRATGEGHSWGALKASPHTPLSSSCCSPQIIPTRMPSPRQRAEFCWQRGMAITLLLVARALCTVTRKWEPGQEAPEGSGCVSKGLPQSGSPLHTLSALRGIGAGV